RDFFDFGILHLKPLTLQDVASMAGVHESTVSRATNGKYAQTPRGLFELKFFFSGAARTQSGDDVSTMAVKQRINDIVKSEDPSKPLSDSAIVDILAKEGIELARRTVAKYRIELNIPSSSARRRK
ncbi:MAG: LacI family DNA-binding transcriptional regulator, partial [Candidatus Riflebacteria bacterium]|nr:LacI family DNA-binding transcriptional regulator [Candidatus Riflebacteria bacterium]